MQVLQGEELAELVRHLKLKWQSLNEAYVRLPCVLDTPSKRRRKEASRGPGRGLGLYLVGSFGGRGARAVQGRTALVVLKLLGDQCRRHHDCLLVTCPAAARVHAWCPRACRSWRRSWGRLSGTCACSARQRRCASAQHDQGTASCSSKATAYAAWAATMGPRGEKRTGFQRSAACAASTVAKFMSV